MGPAVSRWLTRFALSTTDSLSDSSSELELDVGHEMWEALAANSLPESGDSMVTGSGPWAAVVKASSSSPLTNVDTN